MWCWKKISHNYVTSVSIRNQSTSPWKHNRKPMSPQYRMPTGMIRNYFWVIHLTTEKIITGNSCCAVINIFIYFIWLKLFTKNCYIKFSYFKINETKDKGKSSLFFQTLVTVLQDRLHEQVLLCFHILFWSRQSRITYKDFKVTPGRSPDLWNFIWMSVISLSSINFMTPNFSSVTNKGCKSGVDWLFIKL